MRRIIIIFILTFLSLNIHAQVGINTDSSSPDASAMLDIKSSDKGMLIPRMTSAQRTAIVSPATGLLVFDNTTSGFWFYNGSTWEDLSVNAIFANTDSVTSNENGIYASDDFVFGSPQLDDDGNTDHDSRMFFDKSKGALRAGKATGTNWDADSLGANSVAFGYNTKATGQSSTAMGNTTEATGSFSTAMGNSTEAIGGNSTAMGASTTATGNYSTAMGYGTNATGNNSTAMGFNTEATGSFSTAMGGYTDALSAYETTIGQYNTNYSPNNATGWDAADRLFVIGNGTASGSRSNAMVVLKNGNIGLGIDTPTELLHLSGLSGTDGILFPDNTLQTTAFTDTDTDDQTLTLMSNTLSIEDGNSVDLSAYLDDTDTDDQTLTLMSNTLSISEGNSVDLSPYMDDTDTDDQTLTLSSNTLSIEDGNSVDLSAYMDDTDTDDQTLSLSGNDLTITEGNTLDISSINSVQSIIADADNDTKIQVEESADEDYIRFDVGGFESMTIDNDGNVGIGITTPSTPLAILGNGGTSPVGITQNQVGGTTTLELTTADDTNLQATRMLIRGTTGTADIEFYKGNRGSESVVMFIEGTNGNVGIGNSSPNKKLHVSGAIKIEDGTQGDGKVLVSDATGASSWADPNDGLAVPDTTVLVPIRYHGSYIYVHPTDNASTVDWVTAQSTCSALVAFTYSDWYLPNQSELNAMYKQSFLITGLEENITYKYWSDTEYDASNAYTQRLDYGGPDPDDKTDTTGHSCRCVRKN